MEKRSIPANLGDIIIDTAFVRAFTLKKEEKRKEEERKAAGENLFVAEIDGTSALYNVIREGGRGSLMAVSEPVHASCIPFFASSFFVCKNEKIHFSEEERRCLPSDRLTGNIAITRKEALPFKLHLFPRRPATYYK